MNDSKNYTQYSPTAGNRLQNCKKNAIFLHNNCGFSHELMKCVICLMIHKYSDFKVDDRIKSLIKEIDSHVDVLFKGWDKKTTSFLTEAWANSDRRVDVINLETNDWVEVESKDIDKGDCITVRI